MAKHDDIVAIGSFTNVIVPTLPGWSATDEGRSIYVQDVKKFYYGTDTEWKEAGGGGGTGSATYTSNIISSTPVTLTNAQCVSYAHYVTNTGATTINLPDVSTVTDGAIFICYMKTSYVLTIDPYTSDRICLNGVNLTDGNKIISDGSIGCLVTFHKDSNDGWTIIGRSGYWSDGGA